MGDNIKVSIKVRPLIRREKENKLTNQWKVQGNTISQIHNSYSDPFEFDYIFDENTTTANVYNKIGKPLVLSSLQGMNGTIFAYGQTSSGKTYTMMGDDNQPGFMTLAVREIFKFYKSADEKMEFLLRCGYIEIYNEKVFDLLDKDEKDNKELKIHENINGDVIVNSKELIVTSEEQIFNLIECGNRARKIGETNMNERSSRSHTIFRIIMESRNTEKDDENDAVTTSILNLVDLAGSERADQTGATGSRLKEGSHINKSLLSLSQVIQKLSDNMINIKHINYRDSKLTRILQASLGGNAVTAIICTISPAIVDESRSTLNFAMRAKRVKNKPKVNESVTDATQLKRLRKDIANLEDELKKERTKNMSQLKMTDLERAILERSNQIIHAHTVASQESNLRRRTWCPTTTSIPKPFQNPTDCKKLMPSPPAFKMPSFNPKYIETSRGSKSTSPIAQNDLNDSLEIGDEKFNLNNPFSLLAREIHTPIAFSRQRRSNSFDSPDIKVCRCKENYIENREWREFCDLEKRLGTTDTDNSAESEKILEIKRLLDEKEEAFVVLENKLLESEVEKTRLIQKVEALQHLEKEIAAARKDREVAIKEMELAKSSYTSIDFEFELYKEKTKKREKELIECLNETRVSPVDAEINEKVLKTQAELKRFEVDNYELALKNEKLASELTEMKKILSDYTKNIASITEIVSKYVDKNDTTVQYKMLTSIKSIIFGNLFNEDLLINTSFCEENSSFGKDHESPTKIVLTTSQDEEQLLHLKGTHVLEVNLENQELREKINTLQSINYCRDQTIAELQIEMEKVKLQSKEEKDQVNDLLHQLTKQKDLHDRLTAEYDELSTQIMDSVQEMDSLKNKNDDLEAELSNAKMEMESLKYIVEQKNGCIESLKEEVHILQQKNDNFDAKLISCIEEIELNKELIVALENKKNEEQKDEDKFNSLEKLNKDLFVQIDQLNEEKYLIVNKNEDLVKNIANLTEEIETFVKKNGDLNENIKILSDVNEKLEVEKNDCYTIIAELQYKITHLETEINNFSYMATSVSEYHEDNQAESSIKIEKHDVSINNNIPDVMSKMAQLQVESANLKAEKISLEEKCADFERELLSVKDELDSRMAKTVELSEIIEKLQSKEHGDIQNYKSQIEKLSATLEELAAKEKSLEEIIKEIQVSDKNEKNSLLVQLNDSKEKLKIVEREKTLLADDLKEKTDSLELLEDDKSKLTNEIKEIKEKLVNILEEKDTLYTQFKQYQESSEGNSEKLEQIIEKLTLESDKSDLVDENENLQKQLSENNQLVEKQTQEISLLEEQISKLFKENEDFKSTANTIDLEYRSCLEAKENLETKLIEIEKMVANLEAEKLKCTNELNDKEDVISKNNEEIGELKRKSSMAEENLLSFENRKMTENAQSAELFEKINELTAAIADKQNIIISLEKDKTNLNELLEKMHVEKQKMEENSVEFSDKIENFKREHEKLNNEKAAILENLEKTEKILEELKNENNLLKLEKQEIEAQTSEFQISIEGLKLELTSLQKEKETFENKLFESEKIVAEMKVELQSLKTEKHNVENQHSDEVLMRKHQIEELEKQFEREKAEMTNKWTEQCSNLQEKLGILSKDLENEKQLLVKLESQHSDENSMLKLQIENAQKEFDIEKQALCNINSKQQEQIEKLIQTLNHEKESINIAKNSKEMIQTELDIVKQNIMDLMTKYEKECQNKKLADDKLHETLYKSNELQRKLLLKDQQIKEINSELMDVKEKMELLRVKYRRRSGDCHDLTAKMTDLESTNNKLDSELKSVNDARLEIEDMKKTVKILENEKLELKKNTEVLKETNKTELNQLIKKHKDQCTKLHDEIRNLQDSVKDTEDSSRKPNKDRRSRRHSIFDEKRDCLWNTRDAEVMTESTDAMCNCKDLDEKIKALQTDIKIRDCQLIHERLKVSANPLKVENSILKKEIEKLNEKLSSRQYCNSYMPAKCETCEESKRIFKNRTDKNTQTSEIVIKQEINVGTTTSIAEDYAKLQSKYSDMKALVMFRNETIGQLNKELRQLKNAGIGKENENQNSKKEINNFAAENEQLKNKMKERDVEYNIMRKLYYSREAALNPKIPQHDKSMQTEYPTEDPEKLRMKIEQYKKICLMRQDQIDQLNAKIKNMSN